MFGKYDGNEFNYFNPDSLEKTGVQAISIDRHDNKWLATEYQGIYVFNENGIISDIKNKNNNIESIKCSPNPFFETTGISFYLDIPGRINLTVYNTLGYEVSILADDYLDSGNHEFVFGGSNLPSGTYYYVFKAGSRLESGKLILIK